MSVELLIQATGYVARATYENEAQAVEQAMHDMERGSRDVMEIVGEDGRVLWSNDQLKAKLAERSYG